MSKRAEEKALEVYPLDYGAYYGPRSVYRGAYEQAEKDLAPLIEAATAVYEAWNGGTMDDVRKEMVELGKRIMEAKK